MTVTSDLQNAFANVGKRLEDGEYTGTVTAARVVKGEETWRPFHDVALEFTLDTGDGSIKYQLEIAPLTDKTGNISQGKVNFTSWQLSLLGWRGGDISELEYQCHEAMVGQPVKFSITRTEQDKVNPKTGTPYVNTEVKILDQVRAADVAAAAQTDDPFGDIPH